MEFFTRRKGRTILEDAQFDELVDNYDKVGHALNIRMHYGSSVFDIERVATCSLCGRTIKMSDLYFSNYKERRCPFCACKIEL